MSDLDARCLDAFPKWLRTLAEDALALARVVEDAALPEADRRGAARALNYLFKSLDLIPDGIEDLGLLDDAFVFRVAAAASTSGEGSKEGPDVLARLAQEASLVRDFLGPDYARLERFVAGLDATVARGRRVDDVLSDRAVLSSLVSDVKGWSGSYVSPSFGRDAKNLVKLRSFLAAKLPA
jgi:uncharacterized membrane protein YkvA (DUF1232 family)